MSISGASVSDGTHLPCVEGTLDALLHDESSSASSKKSSINSEVMSESQICSIRVRCSNCGIIMFASAPKQVGCPLDSNALIDLGLPPHICTDSSESSVASADSLRVCPQCREEWLYTDGLVSDSIDAVELYNLRVSGSSAVLCIDCRLSMCDFSSNFLASVHIAPQSGIEIDLSGIDSVDLRKIEKCVGSLIMITDGIDEQVCRWSLNASRQLRKQFANLLPSRYLIGGICAFKRVFPGLLLPPIAVSLPACILSHNQRPSFSSSLSEHDCSTSFRQNLHSEIPSTQTPSCGTEDHRCHEGANIVHHDSLPWLFLGSAQHATDCRVIEKLKLTHIINASNRIENRHISSGIEYLTISIEDAPEASDELSQHIVVIKDFLARVKNSGGRVLVHCMAGVSRSASIAIFSAMWFYQMTLHSAYEHVRACRPVIMPNPGFCILLRQHEFILFGKSSVQHHALFANAEARLEQELHKNRLKQQDSSASDNHDGITTPPKSPPRRSNKKCSLQ